MVLEGVIVDFRPPAPVRRIARRMARPALRRGVDLSLATWTAIVLQLWDVWWWHGFPGERRRGKRGAW